MRAILLIALLAVASRAAEPASVEAISPRKEYFAGERIPVTLRVRYDATFFSTRAVQLFQYPLDLPVQVIAPWFAAASEGAVRVALNEEIMGMRRIGSFEDGLLELSGLLPPHAPGEVRFAGPRLRYAYGTEFVEDFFNGRMAKDRKDGHAEGAPLLLSIRALPAEGRPEKFTGAVGRFRLSARATPLAVAVNESLRLTLRLEGEGSLENVEMPALDALKGFHLYGALQSRGEGWIEAIYEIAPLSAAPVEIPSIPFDYFDPEPPGRYTTVRTKPIPLDVTGGATTPAPKSGNLRWLWWTLLLPLAAFFLIRRKPKKPSRLDQLIEALEGGDGDPLDRVVAYIAHRIACAPAAVVTPDLAARLVVAGAPASTASRIAELLAALTSARYGGPPAPHKTVLVREVIELRSRWPEPPLK